MYTKNQKVVLDGNTVICDQNSSTPGIYRKIVVDKNSNLEIELELSYDISTPNGNLLFWIADGNLKTLFSQYHLENMKKYTFSFDNKENKELHIGILFSSCQKNDSFTIHQFDINTDNPIREIMNVFDNGYTDKTSYFPGETVIVYGNASEISQNVSVVLYNILGEVVDTIKVDRVEPGEITNEEPWRNGLGYQESFRYVLPNLRSGIYLFDNKIPFVIKSTEQTDFTILYAINTVNAYNPTGGKSLYYSYLVEPADAKDRSKYVSIHRYPHTNYYAVEKHSANFIKWMWEQEWTSKIVTDVDMDDIDMEIGSKNFIIVGHSEYWSQNARDKLVNFSGNIINFSGNTLWWKIKYNDDRTVINCDKSGCHTTTYRSLNMSPFDILGVNYEVGGFGTLSGYGKSTSGQYKIVDASSPIFRDTSLTNGDTIEVPTVEFDGIYCDTEGNLSNVYDKFEEKRLCALGDCKMSDGNDYFTGILCLKKGDNTIVNTCSMDWGGEAFKGVVVQITRNILSVLINNPDELFE